MFSDHVIGKVRCSQGILPWNFWEIAAKNGISPCGMPVSAAAAGVWGVREAERNIFGKYAHKRRCVFILRKIGRQKAQLRDFCRNMLKNSEITAFCEFV